MYRLLLKIKSCVVTSLYLDIYFMCTYLNIKTNLIYLKVLKSITSVIFTNETQETTEVKKDVIRKEKKA